jgi:nitroreductase
MLSLSTLVEERRSAALLDPELPGPDFDEVKSLVGLAILAPNHKYTFPWRFHVAFGEDRKELGRLFAEEARARDWAAEGTEHREAQKLLRAPVLIFVGMVTDPINPIRRQEDLLACGAAIENLLLLFQERGYDAMWRTGRMTASQAIPAALGYEAGEETVGILYVGRRPATFSPPPRRRPPVDDVISCGLVGARS